MNKKQLLLTTLLSAATIGASAVPAMAQTNSNDEVIVTGSRISRPNLTSPTAVNTFNEAQIEISGAINVSELIRTLPAAGVSSITSTNSNFTTTASGINTIELRNLGEDRTLVLMNGRRFVGGVPGSQIVDVNAIPTDLIERIDVVTGGASAVYGSDALAGVVNFVLKKDFEGAEFSFQLGQAEDGYDQTAKLTGLIGSNFANDKGNAVISMSYDEEKGIYARDVKGHGVDGLSGSFFSGDPADHADNVIPFYSSFSPYGRIIVPGVGNRVVDETGAVVPFVSADANGNAVHGFNRQAFRALSVPTQRINMSSMINYELRPALNFFSELSYSSTETQSSLEPFALSSDDVYGDTSAFYTDTDGDGRYDISSGAGVSITNPFVPAALADLARQGADLDGDGVADLSDDQIILGFARRTVELDQRGADNKRQTFRIVTGLEGDLGGSHNLAYNVSLNYGRSTQSQQSTGQVDVRALRSSLDVTQNGAGQIVCADPVAVAQGCVPANIFGLGSLTAGLDATEQANLLSWLRAPSATQAQIEQVIVSGYVTGDAIDLPAGPVGFAIGAEYREESSESVGDALTQSGLNAGNQTPPTRGSFDVAEVFGELKIPLFADQPFAESFDVTLAGRYSDYSTVGSTEAYAVSGEWVPMSDLKLRGQYSRAVRAPNISELFQPLQQTFPNVTDPCAGVTATSTGPAAASCLGDPLVAARVARDGIFTPTQSEIQGVSGFNGGAAAGGAVLRAETADTITFGFVWNPSFANWLDPFVISVDYFDISIEDGISSIARGTALSQCYTEAASFDASSPFCANIIRFSEGPSLGALEFINAFTQNLSEVTTKGIDVQASYDLGLNDLFKNSSGSLGDLRFGLNYTYLDELSNVAFPGAGITESRGEVGAAKHKAVFSTVYNNGPATLSTDVQYIGKSAIANEGFWAGPELDAEVFVDLQGRWSVNDHFEIVGGVDNVFDNFVELGFSVPGTSTGWNTASDVYDALGRRFYFGGKARF